jgi:hypothetical protein
LLSSILAASGVTPGHKWHEWGFKLIRLPAGYWTDKARHEEYFNWFMEEQNMTKLEDWYNISVRQFRKSASSLVPTSVALISLNVS